MKLNTASSDHSDHSLPSALISHVNGQNSSSGLLTNAISGRATWFGGDTLTSTTSVGRLTVLRHQISPPRVGSSISLDQLGSVSEGPGVVVLLDCADWRVSGAVSVGPSIFILLDWRSGRKGALGRASERGEAKRVSGFFDDSLVALPPVTGKVQS